MQNFDVRLNPELYDVARLFFGDDIPPISFGENDGVFTVRFDGCVKNFSFDDTDYSMIPQAHRTGRLSKIALYDALKDATGREMPWGALTGVRPTKLFYELLRGGKTHDEAEALMRKIYRVGKSRAAVLSDIVSAQNGKVEYPPEYINLYIHVPYCTTRCSYCSFVSFPIGKFREQSKIYTDLLCDEIRRSSEFLHAYGKKILSIYIGGGTPTALGDDEFEKMLNSVVACGAEFTCEAGRPDTVTTEKADIMKSHGVTRICVNPQTLNNETLIKIGRRHTAEDFFNAYETVRRTGCEINCDLIAGLAGETLDDFKNSFDAVKALAPHNITVHSLSRKNGSAIRYDANPNTETAAMTEYAFSHADNYRPYYLYRQKRQECNLENVGFSLRGHECINNITTMEETVGVMACGSGAISKYVGSGIISRFANMRDVGLYIERYEEKLAAKLNFFGELFENDKKS